MRFISAIKSIATHTMSYAQRAVSKASATIGTLVEDHKLVRRLLLAWACALITWVSVQVFADLTKITAEVNVAFGIVVGLLSTVLALYQTTRSKEDAKSTPEA